MKERNFLAILQFCKMIDGASAVILSMHQKQRNRSIHTESACQLRSTKMTRHGLLPKGLTSPY